LLIHKPEKVEHVSGSIQIAIAEIDADKLHITSCNEQFLKYVQLGEFSCSGKCTYIKNCPALRVASTGVPRYVAHRHPCSGKDAPSKIFILYPVSSDGSLRVVLIIFEQHGEGGLHTASAYAKLEGVISEVLTIISHELKTPLTVSLGCVQLAFEEEDAKRRNAILKLAEKNLLRQSRVIEQMIELTKHRLGIVHLYLRDVDISTILQKAVSRKQPLARERGVEIEAELNRLPPVRADPAYIAYAIEEVIDNSIKFNKENGKVRIAARWDGEGVCIDIEDTGIGISPENLAKIFEPFFQEDSSPSRQYSGLGLGLTIAKKVIELHRGYISVESQAGRGSCFKIWLPAAK